MSTNSNIPDKVREIIEAHDHDIQIGKIDGAYIAVIGTNLPCCYYYYEHNIALQKTSVQDFLDALEIYYDMEFDPVKEARDIYYNNEGELWGNKIVGKDITLDDIVEALKKEDKHFHAMLKDLWENSPRINQNNKDLQIINE